MILSHEQESMRAKLMTRALMLIPYRDAMQTDWHGTRTQEGAE